MTQWLLVLSISVLFFLSKEECWAEFENTPKIIVRGEASIFKPTDQMEVTLGVLTSAANSTQALDENNQRIHQIIANLQSLGLDESDYQTGHFTIRPMYIKSSKGSNEEDRTTINSYEVVNAIQIKTQKIALANEIVNAAVQGGANQVDQVNFNITNPQAYRAEVIQLATQNALDDASTLVNAAGIKLIRVLNLALDYWQNWPTPLRLKQQAGNYTMQAQKEGQDTLQAGKAEIHAIVNGTWEVGSQ